MSTIKMIAYKVSIMLFMSLYGVPANSQDNTWVTSGPPGGSIMTIAINPLNNNIIYVGTVQKGIFKTTDGGISWRHLDSNILYMNQRVIAIHPTAPDTVYAATNGGIFKSSDAGETWRLLYPPSGHDAEYRAFIINPQNPSMLFAGGLPEWKSTDSGESWFQLNIWPRVGIDAFAVNYRNPNEMYFASGSVLYGLGVWKSDDMGETWFSIQNNIDSSRSTGTDVAIDPTDSNILYFSRNSVNSGNNKCLFKSTDGGQYWIDISPQQLTEFNIKKIAIFPHNNQIIFVCTFTDGVLKSTDGGVAWVPKNQGLDGLRTKTIVIDSISDIIYLGTYINGLYKSLDNGETWQSISENITASYCNTIAFKPDDPSPIYASATNGIFKSADIGQSWERINIGIPIQNIPGGGIIFDNLNSNNIFLTSSQTEFPDVPAGIYRSTDSGVSWEFLINGIALEIGLNDIAISCLSTGEKRLFTIGQGVYFSDDMGDSWNLCDGFSPNGPIHTVIDLAPNNPNIIAVGEGWGEWDQRIFISTDRGESWNQTTPLPSRHFPGINSLKFDPQNANHILVASDNVGLFETYDFGTSWADLTNQVPLLPQYREYPAISGIAINPNNPMNYFIQPPFQGVYQSHNAGLTWEPFNNGLDTAFAYGKIYFMPDDTTRLFVTGHAVSTIHRTLDGVDDDAPTLPAILSLSSYPNPFNAQTTISYSLAKSGPVTLTIYNILGQKVAVLFDGAQTAGEHSLVWDAQNQPSGVYFYRLQGGNFSKSSQMVLLR